MSDIVRVMLGVSDRYYKGEINLQQAIDELRFSGSEMTAAEITEALIKGGRNNIHEFPVQMR